jgi:glycosyltransferase involved in cell wall biosynthesis
MRISAIMAAYNSERYLAQALDSVLAQSLPPDEIIVVNDGSTDSTFDVLRAFSHRVHIIRQSNCGPARAYNAAIAASAGDALAFLDSDDLWEPDKMLLQHAALTADESLEAVFGAVRQFISPELDAKTARNFSVPDDPQPGILKSALLIRRGAFERIGNFDEDHAASDFVEWYARANVLGLRWRMLPEVVALRRHHVGNIGRSHRSTQHEEILLALKRSLDMRRGQ